jgi:hypothetical protein
MKENITDKVKNIQDVINIAKPSDEVLQLISYAGTDKHMIGAKNMVLAFLITEVLNQDWVPDWNDFDQRKWFPVFDMSEGAGFGGSGFVFWGTAATGGSRLCFETEELADYAGRTFNDIYKLILNK